MNYIKNIKKTIIDLLFPIKCVGCGEKDKIICNNCLNKIPKAERETERNIIAVFDYRDTTIRKAIWELKYYHKKYIGRELGFLMYEALIEEISSLRSFSLGEPIILIPVPISSKKNKKRGYNQSLEIAKGFKKSGGEKIFEIKENIIYRKTDNNPQARISNRKERLKNVHNAFGIKNEEQIKNRIVIIIDDVTTTGGTITEIMKILNKHGVKKTIGMTVAH